MSGFLEVKLCAKGNRGLTPWKAWKKQWCTLRPSQLKEGGIFLIFHTSVGLASNSKVEIPRHSLVCRTESKTKNYAFGVFPSADTRKPILLLSGQSESDSQLWIGRIRAMLHGNNRLDKSVQQRHSFYISLVDNVFTNLCGFKGLYGNLTVCTEGFQISDLYNNTCKVFVNWNHITDVKMLTADKSIDKNRVCAVTTNRDFEFGHGEILLFCHSGRALLRSLQFRAPCDSPEVTLRKLNRRISRSEGTLFRMPENNMVVEEHQRDSGLSSCGPVSSESNIKWKGAARDHSVRVSADDNGFVLKGKMASTLITAGLMLSTPRFRSNTSMSLEQVDDVLSPLHCFPESHSLHRRCSEVSIASGIYEEISDQPLDGSNHRSRCFTDNTYEVLPDCCSATRRISRRVPPPPLPPRSRNNTRLDSASDSGMEEDSLCSTPQLEPEDGKWSSIHDSQIDTPQKEPCAISSKFNPETASTRTVFKSRDRLHSAFDVFRKRIKSDSQVSAKSREENTSDFDAASFNGSENYPTRKRLFDFHVSPCKPIRMMRNSKMGRALRKLGVGNINTMKNAAKSCETLDCEEANTKLIRNRCSKSEENLDYRVNVLNGIRDQSYEEKKSNLNLSAEWISENSEENIKDLSIICSENEMKQAYPEEILELLLKGKVDLAEVKLRQKAAEEEYVLMSPCNRTTTAAAQTKNQIIAVNSPCSVVEDNYTVMKSAS